MNPRFRHVLPTAAACLLASGMLLAPATAQTTVPSLDKARGAIKNADARASFDQQMGSAPIPDGFGTQLPAGFSRELLLSQLTPGIDRKRVVLTGAKAWPQRPGGYVAVACLAASAEQAQRALRYPSSQCDGENDSSGNEIWFGVFDRAADGSVQLVARTEAAVTAGTDWGHTNIDMPQAMELDDSKTPPLSRPQSWQRFDFARYQLRNGDTAFGVRAGWSEGYAGGGASFEALYLFHIDGKALRVVFAQPMMFNKMIAGDWHKDGTRSHDLTDGSNTLNVLPGTTAGYHDLQLRERNGKWRQTWRWSEASQAYQLQ